MQPVSLEPEQLAVWRDRERFAVLMATAIGHVIRDSDGAWRQIDLRGPRNLVVTELVDDLIRLGLVERGPVNREVWMTAIPTDAGRALLYLFAATNRHDQYPPARPTEAHHV